MKLWKHWKNTTFTWKYRRRLPTPKANNRGCIKKQQTLWEEQKYSYTHISPFFSPWSKKKKTKSIIFKAKQHYPNKVTEHPLNICSWCLKGALFIQDTSLPISGSWFLFEITKNNLMTHFLKIAYHDIEKTLTCRYDIKNMRAAGSSGIYDAPK